MGAPPIPGHPLHTAHPQSFVKPLPCSVKPLCSPQQPPKPCHQPEFPLPVTADVPQGHCRAACSEPACDKRLPLQHSNSQRMPYSSSLTEPSPGGALNANPQLRAVHHKSPALPLSENTEAKRSHSWYFQLLSLGG